MRLKSWWLDEAFTEDERAPRLEGSTTADICIVGGGYTGLWTALEIKKLAPATDVVVLEADVCGSGASGRNGGFAMTMWHHFLSLEKVCGAAEAVRLAQSSVEAVEAIGRFCEDHSIDAEFQPGGWLWTATNHSQVGAWKSTIDAIARHAASPFQEMAPDAVAEATGSERCVAGVYEAGPALVQPAKLARGLRAVALDQGVRIFERSRMVGLERDATLAVRTEQGSVKAGAVVLAINAWSSAVRELRRAFVAVGSDIVLTPPIGEALDEIGLREGLSVSDSRLMVHYYRRTVGGRLAFGKGGGALAFGGRVGSRFDGESSRTAWVRQHLNRIYPQLADTAPAASWTGPIDRSLDGLPFFCRLGRADLICGLGYSGNGVAPSVLGGKILASLALGLDDEWSRCGLVRKPPKGLPPEPARFVGGKLVRGAVERKERAEDAERTPRWIDKSLTRLAPAGLVPTN